jgi:hypothetical protein
MMSTEIATFSAFLDQVMPKRADPNVAVLGPVVWQPSDGTSSRVWYFMAALPTDGDEPNITQVNGTDEGHTDALRAALAMALTGRAPTVIHITECELDMARLCEAVWPCERTANVRAAIEAERHHA